MLIEAKNHGDVRMTDRTLTSYTFKVNFGMEVTPCCGCDLCSEAIISRAATGRVGSRKFQLPLWVASCSVRGSPRPAVPLTLTWPRTFIMLHFATHAHDVPTFSSPAFSTTWKFGPVFSSPVFSTPAIWSHIFQSWLFQSRVFSPPDRGRERRRNRSFLMKLLLSEYWCIQHIRAQWRLWLWCTTQTDVSFHITLHYNLPSVLWHFVGRQEEHPACKNWCHCIPKLHHLLPQLNPDWLYLSGTSLPRLSWKKSR